MNKILSLLAVISLIAFACPAMSVAGVDGIDLQVSMTCPASVRVGGSVTVSLEVYSEPWSIAPALINKSALGVLLPNGAVMGPFTVPINLTVNPGQTVNVPNYITYAMPNVSPSNTIVGHGIVLCVGSFGEDCYEGSACAVEVLP